MIVVTGGSGFIGSHVCRKLCAGGEETVVLDIAEPEQAAKAEYVKASVLDAERLPGIFRGARAVVHLAAHVDVNASLSDPLFDFTTNVEGTLNVLEAARKAGVGKVVYASSAAVYGNPAKLPVSEGHPTVPISPYGISKLSAERLVLLYGKMHGMENVVLRLFNVYGSGQKADSSYSGVITKFASAIKSGSKPVIFGEGKQTRDFVHVDDVVRVLALALESGGLDGPINIGSGSQTTLISLLEKMYKIAGKKPEMEFRPLRKGDILHSVADISLARKKLGFVPEIRLEEGLRELV